MEEVVKSITVETKVDVPVKWAWKIWTKPSDIMQWNIPFDDWHCPKVENEVIPGGKFLFRMETSDGSDGFDQAGTYDRVIPNELIEYTVADGRKSRIVFSSNGDATTVSETFEPE